MPHARYVGLRDAIVYCPRAAFSITPLPSRYALRSYDRLRAMPPAEVFALMLRSCRRLCFILFGAA